MPDAHLTLGERTAPMQWQWWATGPEHCSVLRAVCLHEMLTSPSFSRLTAESKCAQRLKRSWGPQPRSRQDSDTRNLSRPAHPTGPILLQLLSVVFVYWKHVRKRTLSDFESDHSLSKIPLWGFASAVLLLEAVTRPHNFCLHC